MSTHASQRHDDATTAREVPCPHCEGKGEVTTGFFSSSLDPGATREFRQRCFMCGGSGKVPGDGAAGE